MEVTHEELIKDDFDLKMVTRRCLKPECPKLFNVAWDSEQRFCSQEHNPIPAPNVGSPWKKNGKPKLGPGVLDKVKEIVTTGRAANLSARQIKDKFDGAKLLNAYGQPFTIESTYGFIARFVSSKAKEELRKQNESPFVEQAVGHIIQKEWPKRSGKPKPDLLEEAVDLANSCQSDRLPKLVVAIIEDREMDDAEKLGMLRRYGGLD